MYCFQKHTSMYEQQLRWPVLLIIRRLFDSDLVQVPNVNPSITRSRCEDGGVVWGPGETQDFVCVGLECMNLGCWFTQIVEANRLRVLVLTQTGLMGIFNLTDLVCTPRDDKPLLRGVVSHRKNFLVVRLVLVGWVRANSSIPARSKNQNISRPVATNIPYIISVLSSPTLAKMFSFCLFQSTSCAIGRLELTYEGGLIGVTYPNNR